MRSRKILLKNSKLYLVLDTNVADYGRLFDILKEALKGGVDIVQLRDKKGEPAEMIDFTRRARKFLAGRAPFIVNDRVDVALVAGACGVHLGQEDLPLRTARRLLGPKVLIGVSCQTLAHAKKAQAQGADYIGFGSVFKTFTKPERSTMDLHLLSRVTREIKIPVFAIGGINEHNIARLTERGIKRVALTRAICKAKKPKVSAQHLKRILLHS
jgi:thiamine-phosphate diphosphorylase